MKKTYKKNPYLNESNIVPITMDEYLKRESLKTCPLCKGAPRYVGGGAIECSEPTCGLTLEKETWEDVRDAWNERPDTEEVIEILNDRLKDVGRVYDNLVDLQNMLQSDAVELTTDDGFYLASEILMGKSQDCEEATVVQETWLARMVDIKHACERNTDALKDALEELKPLLEPWETQE